MTNNKAFETIREIEKKNNSKVFSFVIGEPITEKVFITALEQFEAKGKAPVLDVIVQSYGGDINAAYKLVKLFRRNATRYRTWVLNYAKSAAAFICIASDEIVVMPHAELGPLDAQVRDPRDPTSTQTMSALDGFKTLEYLRNYALENFDIFTKLILARSGMNVPDAIDYSTKFNSVILNPLYQQVDPLDLAGYGRVLAIGEEYMKRIFQGHPTFPRNKVKNALRKLIWDYPSHQFVIDYDELKEIGFNVRLPSDDELKLLQELNDNLDKDASLLGFLQEGQSTEEGEAE